MQPAYSTATGACGWLHARKQESILPILPQTASAALGSIFSFSVSHSPPSEERVVELHDIQN